MHASSTQQFSPNLRSLRSTFPPLIPIPETPEQLNPELIPLPLSPSRSPHIEEGDVFSIPLEASSTVPRNIATIEWELEDARREVDETGHAIEELRDNISRLTEYHKHS